MTNEKLIERLYTIMESLPKNEKAIVRKLRYDGIKESIGGSTGELLYELTCMLQDELYLQEAKKSGTGNKLKACKKILKNAHKTGRQILAYPDYQDGMQIICDGYRLVVLTEGSHVKVEEKPESLTQEYELKYSNFFDCTLEKEIELPELAKLKAYYKRILAERKASSIRDKMVIYNFGQDLPAVSCEFLIDGMEIIPIGKAYLLSKTGNLSLSSIVIVDDEGNKYLLLPVKKADKNADKTNID